MRQLGVTARYRAWRDACERAQTSARLLRSLAAAGMKSRASGSNARRVRRISDEHDTGRPPSAAEEPILEPDLPIIDPHHHLWDRPAGAVRRSDGVEHDFTRVIERARGICSTNCSPIWAAATTSSPRSSSSAARCTAPTARRSMRPVGETEFVNGVAAMSASGVYGAGARLRRHRRPRRPDAGRGGRRGAGGAHRRRRRPLPRHPPQRLLRPRSRRCWARCAAGRRVSTATTASARASPGWRRWGCRSTPGCWSRSCPT